MFNEKIGISESITFKITVMKSTVKDITILSHMDLIINKCMHPATQFQEVNLFEIKL